MSNLRHFPQSLHNLNNKVLAIFEIILVSISILFHFDKIYYLCSLLKMRILIPL